MKKTLLVLLTLLFIGSLHSQHDSCMVIQILRKEYADTSGINSFYQKKGMFLVQNGIYDFKINGKSYFKHRIVKIEGDTISLAWATEDTPLIYITVEEIEKVIFPSLNNGVTGFPHPYMSERKYTFQIVCRQPYKNEILKLCENDDCSKFNEAYLYMTSGFGWKPVYTKDGKTYMLDVNVLHELKKE